MMRRRNFLHLFASLLPSASTRVMASGRRSGRHCSVDLPNHKIEYVLPEELARQLRPEKIDSRYDPSIPFQRGYQGIVSTMYAFEGPFWRDANAGLWFAVLMQERSADYSHEITTIEGLKNYVASWFPLVNKAGQLEVTELNGAPAVLRKFGEWDECWSFPIDQRMFVEFSLRIRLIEGDWSGGWVDSARRMRDEIRRSIHFLHKQPAGDQVVKVSKASADPAAS